MTRKKIPIKSSTAEQSIPVKKRKIESNALQQKITSFLKKDFARSSRLVKSSVGQRSVTCAGVGIAVLGFFFGGRFEEDFEENFELISRELQHEGERLYLIGRQNDTNNMDENNHIEIAAIYDLRENFENIVTLGQMTIAIQSSHTAINAPENLNMYVEGFPKSNFREVFEARGCRSWTNFVLGRRGSKGGHFITCVVLKSGQWMLVDGLGGFKYYFYDSLDSLLSDIAEYVAGHTFNLSSARVRGAIDSEQPNNDIVPYDEPAPLQSKLTLKPQPTQKEKICQESESGSKDECEKETKSLGVCMFQKCLKKTVLKSGFCDDHLPQINAMRSLITQELRIKCPVTHEDCLRIVPYKWQTCPHHRRTKIDSENSERDETITISQEITNDIEEIKKSIEKHIRPTAEKGIEYYIGITLDLDQRLTNHLFEHRNEIRNVHNIKLIPLMTCVGAEQAARAEKIAIAECVLSDNIQIRSRLLNSSGGGDLALNNDRHKDAIYTLYMRIDQSGETEFAARNSFQDGYLDGKQLIEVFKEVFGKRNLAAKIENGKDFKFGLTSEKGYAHRMTQYNNLEEYDYVSPSSRSCCLIAAGEVVTLKNGTRVKLHPNDIRKMELVAISQVQFGDLSKYGSKSMNVVGGGEYKGPSHEILYVRFGKKKETSREKKKVEEKFYNETIPRTKQGKIDWAKLIPLENVVMRCGGELKVKKKSAFKCVCGKEFAFKTGLIRHRHHCEVAGGTKEEKVPCPLCNRLLVERNIPDHIRVTHDKKDRSRASLAMDKKFEVYEE